MLPTEHVRVKKRTTCRVCGGLLNVIWRLGRCYFPDWPLPTEPKPPVAPLTLTSCASCGLVQLGHTVEREVLFRRYWYRSAISATMRAHLASIVDQAISHVPVGALDVVLDIGSNDGTLLNAYPSEVHRIGFEPSDISDEGSHQVVRDFFSAEAFMAASGGQRAKIVTAIAMFYDLEKPLVFLKDVRDVLHPRGIAILEMNYLGAMLSHAAADHIGHEHLVYYSVTALAHLARQAGLRMAWASENQSNGGSIRVGLTHPDDSPSGDSVTRFLASERFTREELQTFTCEASWHLRDLGRFVRRVSAGGRKVYVLGASTRGITILHVAGLDRQHLAVAVERDERKLGRLYTGFGIPIISEEQARAEKPDFMLVLPYHFADEIRVRERIYLEQGGALIIPLSTPRLITKDGVKPLC